MPRDASAWPPRARGPRAATLAVCLIALFACGGATAEQATEPVTYFVAEGEEDSGYRPSDSELAVWALHEWAARADPPVELKPGPEETATIRVFWVRADDGLYGEMRPRRIGDRVGADVFVRPDIRGLGPDVERAATADALYREAIVYLTCVHELGHAFGLQHTAAFDDIMYSFQYGGDIEAYFGRYRERLTDRGDIPATSPLSEADVAEMRRLWSR